MKIIKCKNYDKLYKKSWEKIAENEGCRECGRQAVIKDGLCWKCIEEKEKRDKRNKS